MRYQILKLQAIQVSEDTELLNTLLQTTEVYTQLYEYCISKGESSIRLLRIILAVKPFIVNYTSIRV